MNQRQVDYIVVGGYAVNFHGYSRPTGDLDIWICPTNENKLRFLKALEDDHFPTEELKEISFAEPLSFHLGEPPFLIDIMTHISGVKYAEASAQKMLIELEKDFVIPFLHLNQLIVNKFHSGRLKDLADIEELQKLKRAR